MRYITNVFLHPVFNMKLNYELKFASMKCPTNTPIQNYAENYNTVRIVHSYKYGVLFSRFLFYKLMLIKEEIQFSIGYNYSSTSCAANKR